MFLRRFIVFAAAAALFAMQGTNVPAKVARLTDADRQFVESTFETVLGKAPVPDDIPWPPTLIIEESLEDNAWAMMNEDYDPPRPEVHITTTFLKLDIKENVDRLAMLFGHELAHLVCGHTLKGYDTTFNWATDTRVEEHEADLVGLKMALDAGYNLEGCLSLFTEFMHSEAERGSHGTCFDALMHDHPSPRERLAYIDELRSKAWQSLGSFHTGVQFLMMENYPAAKRCFADVVARYPNCQEAWANLGYAELMMYCDYLTPADLRDMEIPPVVIGAFYSYSESLEAEVDGDRGGFSELETLWRDAIAHLTRALELDNDSMLAAANLGLAYLLCPNGKDVGEAYKYLDIAAKLAESDDSQPIVARAAVLANAGALDLEAGQPEMAMKRLAVADSLRRSFHGSHPDVAKISPAVLAAIRYHRAQMLAASSNEDERREAAHQLELCLKAMCDSSYFWPQVYEQYAELCAALGSEPEPAEALAAPQDKLRQTTALLLADGQTIDLGMTVEELQAMLGEGELESEVPGTCIRRLRYADQQVSVLVTYEVVAIFLTEESGPALQVRYSGQGSLPIELRIGMTESEVRELLGDRLFGYEPLVESDVKYQYFGELGVGIRYDENGRVIELLLARMPKQKKSSV